MLFGDANNPETLLTPDQERHHGWWNTGYYRTLHQESGFRFIPLCDVRDETYTVYFPIRNPRSEADIQPCNASS
jgi:hypothetical protein